MRIHSNTMSYQPYQRGAWVWHRSHGKITVLSDENGTVDFVTGHVTVYGTARNNVFVTESDWENRR